MSNLVSWEDLVENLTQKKEILDWWQIRPHRNQYFSHFEDVLVHLNADVLELRDSLLSLTNFLHHH